MSRAEMGAVLAVALLVSSSAAAWEPIAPSQPVWRSLPVAYWVHRDGSDDLGVATAAVEVRRGMEDWAAVSCTSLEVDHRGTTSAAPGADDEISTIGWVESAWPHASSAVGVTSPRWSADGTITEADIELNGVNFTWTKGAGSSRSEVDAYSIVLHEAGHFFGLGHSDVRGSAMWPTYAGGVLALATDDEAGICALYPRSSHEDCTTTGCPAGHECIGGDCEPISGGGTVCSPCTATGDCTGAGALCLGYPDGHSYCGRACRSDADCEGDRCVETTGGLQCVRYDGSTPSCTHTPRDCSGDGDCATGEVCDAGTCVARPAGELGDACVADEDCIAGVCTAEHGARYCTRECDGARPCPDGFACARSETHESVCVRLERGLGQECDSHDDCESRFCAVDGDEMFCAEPCDDGTCPEGFRCVATRDAGVCRPDVASERGGCGCAAAPRGGLDAVCVALVALTLFLRRRR